MRLSDERIAEIRDAITFIDEYTMVEDLLDEREQLLAIAEAARVLMKVAYDDGPEEEVLASALAAWESNDAD